MAKKQDSLDLALSCGVCMEEFGVDGSYVPRLLPCTHTLCETCVKQLIRENKLECPECRKKHEVRREEKSFPQNKYLLTQIRRLQQDSKKIQYEYEKCAQHKRELILFCREAECQKVICTTCLKTSHKKHDVTEIEDEKKEIAMKSIEFIKTGLQKKMCKISKAKEDIEKEVDICINELKKEKENIWQTFDEAIKETEKMLEQVRTLTMDELSAMNEAINVLNDVKESTENVQETAYEDIMAKLDTINDIEENIKTNLSGTREYVYHKYLSRPEIGKMVEEKRVIVELTDHSDDDDEYSEYADSSDNDGIALMCEVTTEIGLEVFFLAPLSKGHLVLCGPKNGAWKLKSYNLLTGLILKEVSLDSAVRGMSSLKLGDTAVLAISYKDNSSIEFRTENLDQMLNTKSVAPCKAGRLCTVLALPYCLWMNPSHLEKFTGWTAAPGNQRFYRRLLPRSSQTFGKFNSLRRKDCS